MKSKTKELNVDSIGDQRTPLTKEEQLTITLFIKKAKEKKKKSIGRKRTKLDKQFS